MSQNTEDLRIRRTKESIRESLKQMVMEMPYEKITVKALAERAFINRNTFYLHYESTDDVLREIQADYMERYLKLVEPYIMESQDDFFKKITCDSRLDYVREPMQRKVLAKSRGKSDKIRNRLICIQNMVQVYSNTTLQLYRQWVADGRKIPLREVIDFVANLMEHGMQGIKP